MHGPYASSSTVGKDSHYRINRVCLDMTPMDTSFRLLRMIGMNSNAVSWTIGNSAKKWRSRPKKNRIIVRARACPFSTARALASALGCAPAAVGTLKHRMPWQQSLRLTGCCLLHRALTKITKSDTEGEESPGSVVTVDVGPGWENSWATPQNITPFFREKGALEKT